MVGDHVQNGLNSVGDVVENGRDIAADGFNEVKEGSKGILKVFGFGESSTDGPQYENLDGTNETNPVDMGFADSSDDEGGLEDALEVGDTFEETREEVLYLCNN